VSRSSKKGRPAPRRRPASIGARVMDWVNRITPWFAVVVIGMVAVWLVFPLYAAVDVLMHAQRQAGALWWTVALHLGALVGTIFIGLVAVRAVSPEQTWPSDGATRALASIGLLLSAFTVPLLILRAELIPAVTLVIYYVRVRRALVDILPPWAGGTWRPEKKKKRQPRRGEEVIKRPPRSWDEPSDEAQARPAEAPGAPRRRQGKKKRRSGR
jgi:hypothetical protein